MSHSANYVYPVANDLAIEEQVSQCVAFVSQRKDLSSLVALSSPDFRTPAHHGVAAGEERLFSLRELLVEAMEATKDLRADDRDKLIASELYSYMELLPAHAADRNMWATLAAYVVPDLVAKRFADHGNAKIDSMRFRADRRNALSRLWFRRHVLSEKADFRFAKILSQDLVQQIIERPALGSDRRIVNAFLAILQEAQLPKNMSFRSLYREFIKEVSLLQAISVPQLMTDSELATELLKRFEATLSRIEKD